MIDPRRRKHVGTLALIAAGTLLAGCASSAPGWAAPGAEQASSSPSPAVSEAGAATPRIVLTCDGGLLVANARDGAVLPDHKLEGFNRVNPAGDGRRVLVSTAGDSRSWTPGPGMRGTGTMPATTPPNPP